MVIEIPSFFGEWLRQRRSALDLTRAELARCAGCSVSALRKIEAGDRRPSKQLAGLLAGCLRIPTEKQATFVRSARGELRVDRLGMPMGTSAPDRRAGPATLRPSSNLPIPPTPMIGRAAELEALAQLLNDVQCRLLTLVGPGGIGKTHLAIQAAAAQRESFSDGAYFVPLVGVRSAESIAPAIAKEVGFNFVGSTDPLTQLIHYLHSKQVLLLLDNLEHLLGGVERISRLLERAPGLKLLATSRERLNLRGEWTFEVQGLPVPAHDQLEGLEDYSAVELFVQSARRARMSFELPVEERPYLARICRLVEGMPLGIELAAAWAQVLSCREIVQEIEQGLEFLSTSARDVPERHRSMRAVFDHSWALLSDRERQVLRRLSVFRGGFRRAAAEAVAGADLPLLAALAAKSLLRRTSTGRYDLHELVRQYAAGQLDKDPDEASETRDRHGFYYTERVAQLEESLKGEQQPEALAEMSVEIDNVRDAWRWAITRGQVAAIQRIIKGLWLFYEIRGWFEEAEAAFRWAGEELDRANAAQEVPDPSSGVLREFIRASQGWFCYDLGRLEEARSLLASSLVALRAFSADAELQDALHHAGLLEWLIGSYARSRANFLEELALATQREDRWAIARARGNIGMVAQDMGEYEEALEQMRASVADFRMLGDQRMVASALHFLGALECTLGAYDQARAHLRESLALSGTIDDRWIQGLALGQLGYVARARGEYLEAVRFFQESLALVREFGERWSMCQTLNGLGATTLAMGDYDGSRSAFLEALALAREIQAWPEALDALAGLANGAAQNGEPEAALAQAALVRDHPATKQGTRARAAQLGTELAAQLTRQQIAAVEARTQVQSFDALVTELLAASPAGPL